MNGVFINPRGNPVPICQECSVDRPSRTFPWTEELDRKWLIRKVLTE